MQKVVAVIQARLGSERLPNKMLIQLAGHSVIEWVLRRLLKSETLNEIILAIPEYSNEELADIASILNIKVIRGSESNVLSRFVLAAEATSASAIVRICADNPFIDPIEIDRLVTFFNLNNYDFAFNHIPKLGNGYADGFGAEIMTIETLNTISKNAKTDSHLEHVTSYVWDNLSQFSIGVLKAPPELSFPDLKFDIDTESDLIFMSELARIVGIHGTAENFIKQALAYRAPIST